VHQRDSFAVDEIIKRESPGGPQNVQDYGPCFGGIVTPIRDLTSFLAHRCIDRGETRPTHVAASAGDRIRLPSVLLDTSCFDQSGVCRLEPRAPSDRTGKSAGSTT